MSIYLYGFVRASDAAAVSNSLRDVETSRDLGSPSLVSADPLVMVVSEVVAAEIRPNRRNLLTHMRVLEAIHAATDVLPVRFGQVFDGESELIRGVEPNLPVIAAECARLAGKVEVSVRVSAPRDHVIGAIAGANPDLKSRHAAISAKGAAGHFELIELGREIGAHLARWRESSEACLRAALEPCVVSSQIAQPAEDAEILRGDFLLESNGLGAFEATLATTLDTLDLVASEALEARIVGPTPPGSFVQIAIANMHESPLGSAA